MYFATQQEYERYHSPAQRQARIDQAKEAADTALNEAHRLFALGDTEAARQTLFDTGIQDEGIVFYLNAWRH